MLFSFSDLFEKLRDYWRATVKPSWQNLLSEKRNTLRVLVVIVLLETLLCLLFASYSNNLSLAASMRAEAEIFLKEQAGASTNALAATKASLNASISTLEAKNTAVFIFSAATWFFTAFFIFFKTLSASVELKTFVYGLYITFGANTKKIRSFIFCQMLTLALAGLIPAIPTAQVICGIIYGFSSFGELKASDVLIVVGGFAVLLICVISLIAHKITKKTCVALLASSDVSGYVHSPSRSFRRVDLKNPIRLAAVSIWRMRTYHVTLAISAILPACLFFCCMSLAASCEQRNASTGFEYSLLYRDGVNTAVYQNDIRPSLERIDGVYSTQAEAQSSLSYTGGAGAHVLLSQKNLTETVGEAAVYGGTAADEILILSADYHSMKEHQLYPASSGYPNPDRDFGVKIPPVGSATMLYPRSEYGNYPTPYKPLLDATDGTVFLAHPNASQATATLSEKVLAHQGGGISLTVNKPVTVNNITASGSSSFGGYRLEREILLLHPDDFARLTGIDVAKNIDNGVATPAVRLSDIGSFLTCDSAYFGAALPTVSAAPMYAGCGFTLDLADEFAYAQYGIPTNTSLSLEEGAVILVLSPFSHLKTDISVLCLSGTTELSVSETLEDVLSKTAEDYILEAIATKGQVYQNYRVAGVIVSDAIDSDVILMHEADLSTLCKREAAYTSVRVEIPMNTEIREIASVLLDLNEWTHQAQVYAESASLSQTGELWDAATVRNFHYTAIARSLAVILLLSVPFIWFCPQYNFYRKRKPDLELITILGQPRSRIFSVFVAEGTVAAILTTLAACILCPIFTLVTFEFLKFNGFPFAYSSLDTTALILVLIYSALCALGTTVLNFFILFSTRRGKVQQSSPFKKLDEKE